MIAYFKSTRQCNKYQIHLTVKRVLKEPLSESIRQPPLWLGNRKIDFVNIEPIF